MKLWGIRHIRWFLARRRFVAWLHGEADKEMSWAYVQDEYCRRIHELWAIWRGEA